MIQSGTGTLRDKTIMHYMPTGKLEGVTRQHVLNNNDYASTVNGLPNNQFYWHIFTHLINNSSVQTIHKVNLTYYCRLERRALVSAS